MSTRRETPASRATAAASRAVECMVSRARSDSASPKVQSWTSRSASRAASTVAWVGRVSPVTTTVRPRRGGSTTSSGRTSLPPGSTTVSPRWSAP